MVWPSRRRLRRVSPDVTPLEEEGAGGSLTVAVRPDLLKQDLSFVYA
jgi:hypothetical protein